MKKLYFVFSLIVFTTSHIQASQNHQRSEQFKRDNEYMNPCSPVTATSSSIVSPTIEVLQHPRFDPALGSPCWQATKSYCSDIKNCCLTRSCTSDRTFSNLPKPVAQYRECCKCAETCCCVIVMGSIAGTIVGLIAIGC